MLVKYSLSGGGGNPAPESIIEERVSTQSCRARQSLRRQIHARHVGVTAVADQVWMGRWTKCDRTRNLTWIRSSADYLAWRSWRRFSPLPSAPRRSRPAI